MTSPSVQPLGRYVLVALVPEAPRSAILTVPASDSPHQWADVLAVGPDVRDYAPGDHVFCSTNQGVWVGDQMLLPDTAILLKDAP